MEHFCALLHIPTAGSIATLRWEKEQPEKEGTQVSVLLQFFIVWVGQG